MKKRYEERLKRIIRRRDIVIIEELDGVGSEQRGNKFGVVVSNDIGNHNSTVVKVVIITSSKTKKNLPTHCIINTNGINSRGKNHEYSTVICEQIRTVDKIRIRTVEGRVTNDEMKKIEKCLLISLGMRHVLNIVENYEECI